MSFTRIKRLLIGRPLTQAPELTGQALPQWKALAAFCSDSLSSVAYATEEILLPLAAFSAAAIMWSIPVALGVTALLVILIASYRQRIETYPGGGGAYVIAKENLGTHAALVAGAALLIDYVLTVAVSVAAAEVALLSAFPIFQAHQVGLAVLLVVLLTLLNLRGVSPNVSVLAVPSYLFLFSILSMLATGVYRIRTGQVPANLPQLITEYPTLPLFLLLRAFSSGCVALTGAGIISNNVSQFRPPMQRNAQSTLTTMAVLLAVMFLGITYLARAFGVTPSMGQTVLSSLARTVFGPGGMYYVLQLSTAVMLLMAANTSYARFPMQASLLAKDRFLPRQLASLGDKLVFSNGIIVVGLGAIVLIVTFAANPHALIPLYAIGVFISYTLSQAGLVVYHRRERRERKPGSTQAMLINGIGCVFSLLVTMVILVTKFTLGAWIVAALVPLLVLLFVRIEHHYLSVGSELSLIGVAPPGKLEQMRHTVIIPVSGIHRGVIDALRYGISISSDVRACYVELDSVATERMQVEWKRWAHEVPFVVLKSPYRSVITPLLEYINDVAQTAHDEMITLIIPEFVTAHWWHRVLHNQTAFLIRTALLFRRGIVVTSVRYHLKS